MLTLTPANGITPEELAAEMARRAKSHAKCTSPNCLACNGAEYQASGPTSRWIAPKQGALPPHVKGVLCPTCGDVVPLALFLTHGCGAVSRHQAWGGTAYPAPMPRKLLEPAERKPRKYWLGDVPTHCARCEAPLRRGFSDSPLPGRSSWGHLCGLCYTQNGNKGQYYEKTRAGRWLKKEG